MFSYSRLLWYSQLNLLDLVIREAKLELVQTVFPMAVGMYSTAATDRASVVYHVHFSFPHSLKEGALTSQFPSQSRDSDAQLLLQAYHFFLFWTLSPSTWEFKFTSVLQRTQVFSYSLSVLLLGPKSEKFKSYLWYFWNQTLLVKLSIYGDNPQALPILLGERLIQVIALGPCRWSRPKEMGHSQLISIVDWPLVIIDYCLY